MERKTKTTLAIAIFLVAVMVAGSFGSVSAGPKPPKECNDDIDNDGDGDIDLADGGCDRKQDNDETNCGDGVCEGGEDSGSCPADCHPDSCSDTDGGYNPSTFGTTSGYLNNVPYSSDDYCVDTSNINEYYCANDYETSWQGSCGTDYTYAICNEPANDSVYQRDVDYFCSSGACDYTITETWVEDCQYGCSDGACNPAAASCSDTDSGWDTFVQGTVTGNLEGGDPYEWTDFCNGTTMLMEHYCNGDSPIAWEWDCANNATTCSNGACI
jgi:hypothetical protein